MVLLRVMLCAEHLLHRFSHGLALLRAPMIAIQQETLATDGTADITTKIRGTTFY
jgi:hypothetical protein